MQTFEITNAVMVSWKRKYMKPNLVNHMSKVQEINTKIAKCNKEGVGVHLRQKLGEERKEGQKLTNWRETNIRKKNL